jgi:nitrate reductase (cytochrome), electron transfer subunit
VTHREPGRGVPQRVLWIGSATAAMAAVIAVAAPGIVAVGGGPGEGRPGSEGVWADGALTGAGAPIRAEAGVFRLQPGDLAASPDAERRPEAHPRTMGMFRALRAYPGAPPRIPHGLTTEEFRDGRCNVCHERGGYVARFAAYAPVTPHPELHGCLQCHVADDALVGLAFPDKGVPGQVCFQCHVMDAPPARFAALDWPEPDWPRLHSPALVGGPPPIPHGSELRENCLACHMGAGAIEEIRTRHPERANCRQCHVPAEAEAVVEEFTRAPVPVGVARAPEGAS